MVERHPFKPFLPKGCKLLMLGSFPPSQKRWCMNFFYPNFTNDMWRIFGLAFFEDKQHFVDEANKIISAGDHAGTVPEDSPRACELGLKSSGV